jgi:hypothetical protein
VFDGQRNRWNDDYVLDPLATGAVLFGRGDFKSVAGQPREEMVWLLGDSGLTEFDRLPIAAVARGSTALETVGCSSYRATIRAATGNRCRAAGRRYRRPGTLASSAPPTSLDALC